jgi:subtilisin-like proprotein convertase family protein
MYNYTRMKIKFIFSVLLILSLFTSCFLTEDVEISGLSPSPAAIPDNTVTQYIINENEGGTVNTFKSITLENLQHSWAADLVITITAPDGKTRVLVENDGDNHDYNGNYTFVSPDEDDYPSLYNPGGNAIYQGPDIISQTLRARGRLEELTPSSMAGEWILTIDDGRAGDTGSIDDFTIKLTRYKWW